MSESNLEKQREFQKTYDNFQEGKKLTERYIALKRKLETCREVKSTAIDSLKDKRAVSYFETCEGQILSKLDQHEQSMKKILEQMENTKRVLEEKLEFVKQRLSQAKDRAENQNRYKTKEEILIERELQDMIPKYSELVPNCDLTKVFPEYKQLLNLKEPIPSVPVYTPPPNIPPSSTSFLKAKRKVKTVDETPLPDYSDWRPEPVKDSNPLATMTNKQLGSLSEAEVWNMIHPNRPNPFESRDEEDVPEEEQEEEEEEEKPPPRKPSLYGNVVQNSKVKRGQ